MKKIYLLPILLLSIACSKEETIKPNSETEERDDFIFFQLENDTLKWHNLHEYWYGGGWGSKELVDSIVLSRFGYYQDDIYEFNLGFTKTIANEEMGTEKAKRASYYFVGEYPMRSVSFDHDSRRYSGYLFNGFVIELLDKRNGKWYTSYVWDEIDEEILVEEYKDSYFKINSNVLTTHPVWTTLDYYYIECEFSCNLYEEGDISKPFKLSNGILNGYFN